MSRRKNTRKSKARKLKPASKQKHIRYKTPKNINEYALTKKKEWIKRFLILYEGETEFVYIDELSRNKELTNRINTTIIPEFPSRPDNDIRRLILTALKERKRKKQAGIPFDEIWIVIDNDKRYDLFERFFSDDPKALFFENDEFIYYDKTNKVSEKDFYINWKENINIAYSSIAFENWILLHFEKNKTTFENPQEIINYITQNFAEYDKGLGNERNNRINAYECLKSEPFSKNRRHEIEVVDKVSAAIENAVWLRFSINENNIELAKRNPYTNVDELARKFIDYPKVIFHKLNQTFEINENQFFVSFSEERKIEITIKAKNRLVINNENFKEYFYIQTKNQTLKKPVSMHPETVNAQENTTISITMTFDIFIEGYFVIDKLFSSNERRIIEVSPNN